MPCATRHDESFSFWFINPNNQPHGTNEVDFWNVSAFWKMFHANCALRYMLPSSDRSPKTRSSSSPAGCHRGVLSASICFSAGVWPGEIGIEFPELLDHEAVQLPSNTATIFSYCCVGPQIAKKNGNTYYLPTHRCSNFDEGIQGMAQNLEQSRCGGFWRWKAHSVMNCQISWGSLDMQSQPNISLIPIWILIILHPLTRWSGDFGAGWMTRLPGWGSTLERSSWYFFQGGSPPRNMILLEGDDCGVALVILIYAEDVNYQRISKGKYKQCRL